MFQLVFKISWVDFCNRCAIETKQDSKYTGKNSTCSNHLKLSIMPSEVRQKKRRKYVRRNMLLASMNTVKNIFPVSQKFSLCLKIFPVLQQNSLCFPSLEKVKTKFPVFSFSVCTKLVPFNPNKPPGKTFTPNIYFFNLTPPPPGPLSLQKIS